MSIVSDKVANEHTTVEDDELLDEIRWTDDKIRWSDDEGKNGDNDNNKKDATSDDDDDEAALKDPFQAQDSTELFTRTFTLPDKSGDTTIELQGYQDEADEIWKSTGLTLWRASDYLCAYLLEQPQLLFRKETEETTDLSTTSTNVLELGAGLGLVGLLAHRILASQTNNSTRTNSHQSRVVLTDGDTDALAQLRANLRRNQDNALQHQNQTQHRLECRQLLWGRETATKFRNAATATFDVILASDIVYAASIVEPLWETIEVLLSKPATTTTTTTTPLNDFDTVTDQSINVTARNAPCFVLAFAKRRVPVTIDTVLEAAVAHGFTYEIVKEDPTGIWIYVFQWQQPG